MFLSLSRWIDRNILELGREMRLSYLPPLMVYVAAGVSSLTGIVGTFFVKDYLSLSAAFLATLSFWVVIPWSLKMGLGHIVDLLWRFKSGLLFVGASLIAASLLIMVGLVSHREAMAGVFSVEVWYVLSALLAPIGYVLQDAVARATRGHKTRELTQRQALLQVSRTRGAPLLPPLHVRGRPHKRTAHADEAVQPFPLIAIKGVSHEAPEHRGHEQTEHTDEDPERRAEVLLFRRPRAGDRVGEDQQERGEHPIHDRDEASYRETRYDRRVQRIRQQRRDQRPREQPRQLRRPGGHADRVTNAAQNEVTGQQKEEEGN